MIAFKRRPLFIGLIFLLTTSCNFKYINRDNDNSDGRVFLNSFYGNISRGAFAAADTMITGDLRKSAGRSGISKLLKAMHQQAGEYMSYSVDEYNTVCSTEIVNECSYSYKLQVKYKNGIVTEMLGLKKTGNSKIELDSYYVKASFLDLDKRIKQND